jgi:antitoxin (DNA-binding transcriptional repressor) of toxin-antitoxin stability system
MTKTVELDVAQATLSELIAGLGPDEEVLIVRNHQPVARIVSSKTGKPQFGSCQGLLTIVEEDDEHLKDFEEYLP